MNRRSILVGVLTAPAFVGSTAAQDKSGSGPKSPPSCPRDTPSECRFSAGMMTVTLLGHLPPEYDRDGRMTSPPPKPINTATTQWSCSICGTSWYEKEPSW